VAKFTDTAGREWDIKITARRLTRLRELLGFSVSIIATPEGVAEWRGPEVARNPERFADVLAVLLEGQHQDITREQFEDAFDQDVYRDAAGAFISSVLDFSLSPAALKDIFAGASGETNGRPSPSSNGPTNSPEAPALTPPTTALAS
jgi:hypothetical protein